MVISSLAVHHLEDADKQSLFQRIFTALHPGGAFINVDQIKGKPPFDQLYWETWLASVRSAGASEDKIQASIKRRREFDRDKRISMYHRLYETLHEQQPLTLLFHGQVNVLLHKRFRNVIVRHSGMRFTYWWVHPGERIH